MQHLPFKAIFWDIDRTLRDNDRLHCQVAADSCREYGDELTEKK